VVTHPVYLIVASQIFEASLLGEGPTATKTYYLAKQRLIRAVEVALTCGVAALLPDLSIFASLVGASGLTFIGFIMPGREGSERVTVLPSSPNFS